MLPPRLSTTPWPSVRRRCPWRQKGARQPVELGHHESVAASARRHCLTEPGAHPIRAALLHREPAVSVRERLGRPAEPLFGPGGLSQGSVGIKFDERLMPGWSSPHRVHPSWDQMLASAVAFKTDRGSWPSILSPDDVERSLANWLYRQGATRTANRDRKHAERLVKLKLALPDWPSHRSPGDNERWTTRLEQLLEHLRAHGRLPIKGRPAPRKSTRWASGSQFNGLPLKKASCIRNVWGSSTNSFLAGGWLRSQP